MASRMTGVDAGGMHRSGTPRSGPRRPGLRRLLIALLLGLAGIGALLWYGARTNAAMAAAYDAHIACSCRYVAGRTLDDCRRDETPHGWSVWLSEDASRHAVTASVPLVARETARWHAGQGCLLDHRS